ncbi:MAG: 2-C-methyl-D-erythritol 4-phosphate cytidylyltransferase [Pirellulaceae bacterium]
MTLFAVILAAAGKSSRFKDAHFKKIFAPLDGKAVWLHSVDHFVNRADVGQVIVAIAAEDRQEFMERFGANIAVLGIEVVLGGETRADTVQRALAKVRDEFEYVVVHDAARPCVAAVWIDEVFAAAQKVGAAILANPIVGTIKRVDGGRIRETVSRDGLWEAQTPQVFRLKLLLDAYAKRGDFHPTDEAQLIEHFDGEVAIVTASAANLKITTKEDLALAKYALQALPKPKEILPSHPFADDDLWR